MDATAAILFGKTRQAVLTLLFGQPDRRFYLRELARITGISPGALRQELGKLSQADLLDQARDGNRITYRASTAHPVFAELQAIVHKTCGLPDLLREALAPEAARIGLDRAAELVAGVERRIDREIGLRVFAPAEFEKRMAHKDAFVHRVLSGPLTPILGQLHGA
jgi:DNA-binding transcriptional ArsR family regulator